MMGTDEASSHTIAYSRPAHEVTISRPFYIGKYEVTQGQWIALLGANPSEGKDNTTGIGNDQPVYHVSWNQCQYLLDALNRLGQGTFRLPTEAEWEYACRAGTSTRYYWGDDPTETEIDEYAWYAGNSLRSTHTVGGKLPNAWMLFDMSGNVFEWCQDWHDGYPTDPQTDPAGPSTGTDRVMRGGTWYGGAEYCYSAARNQDLPRKRWWHLGLRVVREYVEETPTPTPSPTPLPAPESLLAVDFDPGDLEDGGLIVGEVGGFERAHTAMVAIPDSPGSDGYGLAVIASPGQGAAIFLNRDVDLLGHPAVLRVRCWTTAPGAQIALVGLNSPAGGSIDGQLAYTNPVGEAVPVNRYRELTLVYDPPAGRLVPYLQAVVPVDIPYPITIYFERLVVETMPLWPDVVESLALQPPGDFESGAEGMLQNVASIGGHGTVDVSQSGDDSYVTLSLDPGQLAANLGVFTEDPQPPRILFARANVRQLTESGGTCMLILTNSYENLGIFTFSDALGLTETPVWVGGGFETSGPMPPLFVVQNAGPGIWSFLEVDDLVLESVRMRE